jgi:hypothetical protein
MRNVTRMQDIHEVRRLAAPGPRNIGIAVAKDRIWVGSVERQAVYAMNPVDWTQIAEATVPGDPIGMTAHNGELLVVVGQGEEDDRYIYRFVPGGGFKSRLACPDFTGSHLAVHGDTTYLSQAFNHKILQLDAKGSVVREIDLPRAPIGMTLVDGEFCLVTSDDPNNDEAFLSRIGLDPSAAPYQERARIPFRARGLAFDGTHFWTNDRSKQETIAFLPP